MRKVTCGSRLLMSKSSRKISPSPLPAAGTKPGDDDLPVTHEALTRLLFPTYPAPPASSDCCVILGSGNCGYRVDAALKLRLPRDTRYLVSGGGLMKNELTEAAFMAARLVANGVPRETISIEDSSRCTIDNLVHIKPLLHALFPAKTAVSMILVTAGFHMRRTLMLAETAFSDLPWLRIFPLPAYGPHTTPDNWHRSAIGRRIIAEEFAKFEQLKSRQPGQ